MKLNAFHYAIVAVIAVGAMTAALGALSDMVTSKRVEGHALTRMEVFIMCLRNNKIGHADYNGIESCRQSAYLQVPRQDQ